MFELPGADRTYLFLRLALLGPAHVGADALRGFVVLALGGPVTQAAGVSELMVGKVEEVFDGLFIKFPAFAAPAQTWT